MAYYIVKLIVTTFLIVLVAELSKRSSFIGALLASVPLVSLLAMTWLYVDTKDVAKVSALASSVFWLVLPSLVFFLALPLLLRMGVGFFVSMGASIALTAVCYWLMVIVLGHYGVKL